MINDLYMKSSFIWGEWSNEICFAICLLIMVVVLWSFHRTIIDWIVKNLRCWAIFICCCGILLYMWGLKDDTLWVRFLHSLLSSLQMFTSQSDYSELKESLKEETWYMVSFNLVHILAVLVSAIFIIRLFSWQLYSWSKLRRWRRRKDTSGKVYVFGCVNNASLSLARELKGKGRIIFFQKDNDDSRASSQPLQRFGLSVLLNMRKNVINWMDEVLKELDGVVITSSDLVSGLNRIAKLKEEEFSFFFLSDNEKENIDAYLKIVATDCFPVEKVRFYCHALRSADNELLECNSRLKLIDSSYLSVLELKQNWEAHPVNFVDVSVDEKGRSTGLVSSRFIGLVIGFGETGKEAFSFLYEFSAFPNTGKGERSSYKLVAIDDRMKSIKGNYLAQRPALNGNNNISFCNAQVNSEEYWHEITTLIQEGLNYVVISLGDNDLNI